MIQISRKDKEKVYKAIRAGTIDAAEMSFPNLVDDILLTLKRQGLTDLELRPEIEEDFRQMKDFWKLEDFKSTKYNYITYHIVMTLVGYLYFQIYKNLDEGKACAGKSLPVVVKNYKETRPKSVIIYVGQHFGIFPFLEFLQLYAECTLEVRRLLDPILAKV